MPITTPSCFRKQEQGKPMNRADKTAKSTKVHSDPSKDMADHNYDPRGSDTF